MSYVYEALKKFARFENDEEISSTVDVEEVQHWLKELKENEKVKAFVSDGTYSDYETVKEVQKLNNTEILITNVWGGHILINRIDSNARFIELKHFSLYSDGSAQVSEEDARISCRVGADVFAVGYSNNRYIVTSKIKRFIDEKSFETVSGSLYYTVQKGQ